MDKQPCVDILANKRNGTLYIGVTSDLIKRVWQHKENFVEGFTKRNQVHQLVWYEVHSLMEHAIGLDQGRKKISRQTFRQRRERIEKRFLDFAYATYANKHWQRISKRLAKYAKDLFLFLDVPGLSRDNNAAERGIRPHVIIRNRSYQNRTGNGSHAHSRLTSLVHT